MEAKRNGTKELGPEKVTRSEEPRQDEECSTIWRCCLCITLGFAITIALILNDKFIRQYSVVNLGEGQFANHTHVFNNSQGEVNHSGQFGETDGDDEVEIKDDTMEDLEAERDKDTAHEDTNDTLGDQIKEVQEGVLKESKEQEELAEEDFGEDYDLSPKKEKKWREYKTAFRALAKYGRHSLKLGILPLWQEMQDKMARVLHTLVSTEDRKPMRVLIAASVSGKSTSVQTLTSWAKYFTNLKQVQLEKHGVADQIDFALNHYDYKFKPWEPFMAQYNQSVVILKGGMRCKTVFWKELDLNVSANYDYFWLIDDDLEVDFLNWEITRSLLRLLKPLIGHPGVLPARAGARSSDHRSMRMHVVTESDSIALSLNAKIAEVMAPIISTSFWPLIHKRLETWQLKSVWCMDCFWSNAANRWGGRICQLHAPLTVFHSSPVVHMNYHSILKSKSMHLNTTRRHELGCIKHNIGHNKFLSKFGRDIMRPSSRTGRENRAAYDILQTVVKPKIGCQPFTNHTRFSDHTKWTVAKLRLLSRGQYR